MLLKNYKSGSKTVILVFFVLLADLASCSTYYVDAENGNDDNPGTGTKPFKSLDKAQAVVDFGDTVYMSKGRYVLFIKELNNPYPPDKPDYICPNDSRWITFKAVDNARSVIRQVAFTSENEKSLLAYRLVGLDIQGGGVDLKRIVGFEMKDCNISGSGDDIATAIGGSVAIIRCSSVKFDNCRIRFRKKTCFTISSSTHVTLTNSEISEVGGDHITVRSEFADCNHINITNNVLSRSLRWNKSAHNDAVQFYSDKGRGFYNCVFSGNTVRDMAVQGLYIHGKNGVFKNGTIENNLFYSCHRDAVIISNTTDTVFRNNTISGYAKIGTNDNLKAYNNIIAGSFDVRYPDHLTYHDYNIYCRDRRDKLGTSEKNSFRYATGAQAKLRNDLFVNPKQNDFRLKPNCRAVDFCPSEPAAPAIDKSGNVRDSSPDAGCYEYINLDTAVKPNSL